MQLCNLNVFKSWYTFCPAKVLCKRSVPGYKLICDVEHVQEKKVHSLRNKVKTIKSRQQPSSLCQEGQLGARNLVLLQNEQIVRHIDMFNCLCVI